MTGSFPPGAAAARGLAGSLALAAACLGTAPAAFAGVAGSLEKACPLPPAIGDVRGHVLILCRPAPAGGAGGAETLYATVEPAERREAFVSALSRCALERACVEGGAGLEEPDGSRLVAFHYFRPAPKGTPLIQRPDGLVAPVTWLAELRDEKLKLAEAIFTGARAPGASRAAYQEVRGAGWSLRTDLRDPDDLVALQGGLDFAVRAFGAAFPRAPPVSGRTPLTILFFQNAADFRRLAAFDKMGSIPPGLIGTYTSIDRMIYAARGEQPRHIMARVMAHEAVHHLVAHSFYSGGRRAPVWVNEGIASFIECLGTPGSGETDLAALDRGPIVEGERTWSRAADRFLEAFLAASAAGRAPRLAEFLGERGDAEFYSRDAELAYASAWLLVHQLVNADGGRHRDPFQQWLAGQESQDPESLARAVGSSLEKLEAALPEHARSLR